MEILQELSVKFLGIHLQIRKLSTVKGTQQKRKRELLVELLREFPLELLPKGIPENTHTGVLGRSPAGIPELLVEFSVERLSQFLKSLKNSQ